VEKDRAVNLSQSRSRFLAAASHDLRQPVHALSLFVGALKQNPSPAQSQLILQHVGGAVDAMGAMFNALLDISKLDADLLQPDWQEVDLHTLLARIAADHTAVATVKGLDFVCDLRAAAQQAVYTDPILLERILHNLLSNAVRYTAQGTVAIKVRVRQGRAQVLVADTGAGIARGQREQVFEEFVQLNPTESEGRQGLGLGLSIVRRLAQLLRMNLVLRSKPSRGTVFALHLPLAAAPSFEAAAAIAPAAPPRVSEASDLGDAGVVIVIDDSVEIQLAMRALLSSWGYEVFAAANVPELMSQAMALTQIPRLLLCDYRLRDGANGIEAIALLQETFNHDIPALLITGDTGPERLREAVASGLPLLHKPVTQSQLREAIAKTLVF
jgi:CheY-like chemotaxis protein/anti-sigma regulatory factor (Ser/Thr protein kinase)